MYRHVSVIMADLPDLKAQAKEAIKQNLPRFNIVTELFSSFTSKYQEIIELEVDFLVKNFSGKVCRDFDDILLTIVEGKQTYCFRVLAFTMKMLLKQDERSAWAAVKRTENGEPEPDPSKSTSSPLFESFWARLSEDF
ncbi:hypothetical protein D9756_003559 [Leucocoprinus leucothites]|uniref:Uncharacterized protein n=1 Tax=Leucocoprinus leucothites TaxID=201217 RepID=A0A8H5G7P9_9AGAR|nr:hypothetical protein D9756_003559 [Leucoagaricus leucothites]